MQPLIPPVNNTVNRDHKDSVPTSVAMCYN